MRCRSRASGFIPWIKSPLLCFCLRLCSRFTRMVCAAFVQRSCATRPSVGRTQRLAMDGSFHYVKAEQHSRPGGTRPSRAGRPSRRCYQGSSSPGARHPRPGGCAAAGVRAATLPDYGEEPVTSPESGIFFEGEKEWIRHVQKSSRSALDPDQQPDVDTMPS